MWVGMPKAAGASSTLSLSFRTQLTAAYYHYTVAVRSSSAKHRVLRVQRIETQPLLHQTQLSHLTGSYYSEVATGLSALCSSEGGCYLSLKTQELVKITGSIPCLSPFWQSTQIGVQGITADRCCAGLKRGHSLDNIREREAVLGSEASWPCLA